MNNKLTIFNFKEQEVRIVLLNNEPWFVGKDVAAVLEYADSSMMMKLVDEEDKQTINPQGLDSVDMTETFDSNTYRISILNESGLYAVIFNSTKPEAKSFKKWVTAEVLPSIRKTGSYSIAAAKSPAELILEQAQFLVDTERRLNKMEQNFDKLENKIDPYLPKEGYVTIEAYQKIKKYSFRNGVGSMIYFKAANLNKNQPNNELIKLEYIDHPVKGKIISYPMSLLDFIIQLLIKENKINLIKKRSLTWIVKS